jgi:hypothetical protein
MAKRYNKWNRKKDKKKQSKKGKNLTTSPLRSVTPCHYGNVAVTKTPFPLYGAGYSRGFHKVKDSIVIDLADVILEPKVSFFNMEVPKELEDRYSLDCSVIRIQWVDGGVPTLSPLFWHKLADWLETQGKTVIVTCMGGHGRTGTALAILAGIYRLHGTSDIGEWVRSRHCSHAIETTSQVDYIEEVLGERTAVKPSWAHDMERWANWKGTSTIHKVPSATIGGKTVEVECEVSEQCASQDCGNCLEYNLVELDGNSNALQADDQKIFGYFDKNDVYHTGYPSEDAEVNAVVKQDRDGNDVFEYIYDKSTDGFLPTY